MRHSIRNHLLTLVLLVMMAGFIAIALSGRHLFATHYRQALEQNAQVTGKTLAQQLERLLQLGIPLSELTGFEEQCQETVANHKNVAYAIVVSRNGVPLFSELPNGMAPEPIIAQIRPRINSGKEEIAQSHNANESYLNAIIPVRQLNGAQAGAVIIGIPSATVASKLDELSSTTTLIATGTLLLMFLLLVPVLNRILFRPLLQLLRAIEQIRGKQQDLSKRVVVTSKNEMGQLGNAFNELLSDLEQSQNEIQEHTRSLEHRVEERTIELQRSLESLHDSNERFTGIAESSLDAIVMLNDRGEVEFWNQAAEHITGYSSEEVFGKDLHQLLIPASELNSYHKGYNKFVIDGSGAFVGKTLELAAYRKNGEEFPVEVSVTAVHVNNHWHAVGTMRDITERKRMEAELEHLAIHDSLTGLYNRGELERQLDEDIQRARRYQRPLSLLMLDVDWFKQINDNYGHQAGDIVLSSLAEFLQTELRTQDYVARYGGDEFVIILPETTQEESYELARRLCEEVATTDFCPDRIHRLTLTISIGNAGYPDCGDTMVDLIEAADQALYAAKSDGRNQVKLAIC